MIKEKNIAFLLISSTIVTIAWIAFNLYHTAITSTLDAKLTEQILPISPQFNATAISAIQNRHEVQPTYDLSNADSSEDASPSGTFLPELENPTPTITATPQESREGEDVSL